ncbi:MAG: prepilin-type N-terminal cleavage/methylation domain-containing protein [Phycisphaeraceae bacterium]|nr:MAG: prepilin-type N-terminal cleavage/methylation domain-containing protein [Phycisphaeraceae bacterium]
MNSVGRERSRRGARGLTLIEVVVSIGVISVLISLSAGALAGARREARRVACSANLRTLGIATERFADANRGRLPLATRPIDLRAGRADPIPALSAYLDAEAPRLDGDGIVVGGGPWRCPEDRAVFAETGCSYGYFPSAFMEVSLSRDPSADVTAIYLRSGWRGPVWGDRLGYHAASGVKDGGRNYYCFDGGVRRTIEP